MALSDNVEPVVEKPIEAQQPKKEEKPKMLNAARNLIIMCGPSGAGKSTLIKRLRADYPNGFGFSVSHTTRGPRVGESDGVDYHFTTHEDMEKKNCGKPNAGVRARAQERLRHQPAGGAGGDRREEKNAFWTSTCRG